MNQEFLFRNLAERKEQNAYRRLRMPVDGIDFCSNDYLGIATRHLTGHSGPDPAYFANLKHGSAGSRLLAGNYALVEETEKLIAAFHEAETGLLFNSGYDANIGLLSCVPQHGDTVIYDSLSHASIRDGIRLSFARSYSFMHNDTVDLEKKMKAAPGKIFVVTESVFSMDGDLAPLQEIAALCKTHDALLIVDEAHATGVIGKRGEGLAQLLNLQEHCFARIHTFGKAVGCHGAIILGSELLRNYLVNFSRSFIFTTALPEISVAAIKSAYGLFPFMIEERDHLAQLIKKFQELPLSVQRLSSATPIQALIIPGNQEVKDVADRLQLQHFDVRPVVYPTVPKGSERLRIVLHSFNTMEEVERLASFLQ